MFRSLGTIVGLPVAVYLVVFSLANRATVSIDIVGLDYIVDIPVFVLLFAALFIGIILGGIVVWVGQGKNRSALRKANKALDEMQEQIDEVREGYHQEIEEKQ